MPALDCPWPSVRRFDRTQFIPRHRPLWEDLIRIMERVGRGRRRVNLILLILCSAAVAAMSDGAAIAAHHQHRSLANCGFLRAPTHGYRLPSSVDVDVDDDDRNGDQLVVGTTVRFGCKGGYKLMGLRKIKCKPSHNREKKYEPVLNVQLPLCIQRKQEKKKSQSSTSHHIISKRTAGCVDFGSPRNGQRILLDEATSSGSSITFQCNSGYRLQGASRLTCELGSWGGAWPQCLLIEEVMCGDPGKLIFNLIGQRVVEGTTEGSRVTYSCQAGFALVGGDRVRTCLSSGQWSGSIPRCQDVNCGIPSSPDNGQVDASFFGFSYNATYSCDRGHILVGYSQVTCQENSEWSADPPECRAVRCRELPNPRNGFVSPAYGAMYESMATYECDDGYGLVGEKTRQCMANSLWSGTAPSCQRSRCDQLDDPAHGRLRVTGYTTNDVATYNCLYGYHLIGKRFTTCQENGRWTHSPPICRPSSCSPPIVPINSIVTKTNGNFVFSVATTVCKEGYKLHDPARAQRRCEPTGIWNTSRHAVCVPIACDSLPNLDNGNISLSNRLCYNSEAIFSCNSGHTLRGGDMIITCLRNGEWSGTVPYCSRDPVSCPLLEGIQNGGVSVTGGPRQLGAIATYSCNSGFSLDGERERICLEDGLWSGREPSCSSVVVVTCEELESPDFGSVSSDDGGSVGSGAVYICYSGYVLSGDGTRTCLDTGMWSGTTPTCELVDCGTLVAPSNGGIITGATTVGSVVRYTCNEGFRIVGEAVRRCEVDGRWSDPPPVCEEIRCGGLEDPDNGEVDTSEGDTVDAVATYICDFTYRLVGMETRECQNNSIWSGQPPTCEIIDCDTLDEPQNGTVDMSQGSLSGAMATYSCDPSFTLVGEDVRTCQENGEWSGGAPFCEEIMCQILEDPEFGTVSYLEGGLVLDGLAIYDCQLRYSVVGDENRTCLSNGEWSGVAPTCELLQCPGLDSPPNGMVTVIDNVPGSQAIYSCDSGYMLEGFGSRTCQRVGERGVQWSRQSPTCEPVLCPPLEDPVNGRVTTPPPYPVTSTAVYLCDRGFESTRGGSIRRVCMSDGTWSGSAPECVRSLIFCPNLNPPMFGNVTVQGDRSLGSRAVYNCIPGYQVAGETERECQLIGLIGEWSGQPPTCEEVMCPELEPPVDGRIIYEGGLMVGAKAVHFCNEGFLVSGRVRRECLPSGTWSGTDTVCNPQSGTVSCGRLSDPVSGAVALNSTRPFSVATYSCDLGYVLVGGAIQRRCLDNGTWEGPEPTCEVVDCGPLSDPANGQVFVSLSTTFRATATYECNRGYELTGLVNTVRSCTPMGVWSEADPTCERVDCGTLPPPVNGVVDQLRGTQFMDETLYSCLPDYNLIPPEFRTRICTASGEWSGSRPTCEPTGSTGDCGSLPSLDNGQVVLLNSSTGRFSLAQYACNEGFELNGVSLRQCQTNTEWSGTAPTCTIRECPDLRAPVNGQLFLEGLQVRSSATYVCNSGYRVVGLLRRVCQTNGEWTGEDTRCERMLSFTQTRRSIATATQTDDIHHQIPNSQHHLHRGTETAHHHTPPS